MLRAITVICFLYFPVFEAQTSNECNVYNELEKTTPCGPSGYALHYGLRNCRSFAAKEGLFNAVGKSFVRCTRTCLANFVRTQIINRRVRDCSAIHRMAFDSHVRCYLDCGFCKAAISNAGALAQTYTFTDFFTPSAGMQASSFYPQPPIEKQRDQVAKIEASCVVGR